jgi:sugar phosphate isomerase/epimerase
MSEDLSRLSLNTATTKSWTLQEAVRGCVDAGIPAIGPWRDRVAEIGLAPAVHLIRNAGLHVSSLCRGGFLTADQPSARAAALEDNRRAIDEAAALEADTLVLVVGGLPEGSRDLAGARRRVADALGELAPYAAERGVRLSIEALHPMYCADRAVVSTLGQALDLADPFPVAQVGVVVDTFHVWWDPAVTEQIARAGGAGRIASLQISDLTLPMPQDVLLARAHVGDGPIDIASLVAASNGAGYHGFIEVEIFNANVWAEPAESTIATMVERYRAVLLEAGRHVRVPVTP